MPEAARASTWPPAVAPYRLGGDRIARAARAARGLAAFDGTPLSAAHLRLAARQQSASGLEQHARRIRPAVGWEDLVLPDAPAGRSCTNSPCAPGTATGSSATGG